MVISTVTHPESPGLKADRGMGEEGEGSQRDFANCKNRVGRDEMNRNPSVVEDLMA